MKKLVLKTVAITVAAIILLGAAVYLMFALAFPKTLASAWKNIGNYSLAAKYYEKQYDKSEDIEDLAVLCIYLDVKADSVRAAKYLKILTENEKFSESFPVDGKNGGFGFTDYEYYFGKYALAEFYANKIDAAIAVCTKAVSAGYTDHNAFNVLLSDAENLTKTDGEKIAAAITEIKGGLTGKAEEYANRDIGFANDLQ